ncbi:hypothetical protein [Pumilibacter intestinalis]|nr:hypothetical protein [Pumilibacter intestinalis]
MYEIAAGFALAMTGKAAHVIASEFTSAAIPYMKHVQQLPLSYV